MKRCEPRRWSSLRLLRGVAVLAAIYVAAWVAAKSWFAGVPAVVLAAAIDALCAALARRPRVEATLTESGHGALGVVLVGDAIALDVALDGDARGFLVTPFVTAGLESADEGGAVVTDPAEPLRFLVRALHAGTHVLPGIVLRRASPLGLFSRAHAVPARLVLRVLPDFVSTHDPALSHLFRRAFRMDQRSPRAIRGGGSDFHELREYRPGDPMRRIDWKASARRGGLIARDFDEPLELRMRVLLDASLDMTHDSNERSRFHAAATLVTRLACAAAVRGMSFHLTAYDEAVVLDTTLAAGNAGAPRVASQVADLSRQSLVRRARAVLAAPHRHPRLSAALARSAAWWGRPVVDPWSLADPSSRPGVLADDAEFAADVAPAPLRDATPPCRECGLPVFADEPACPRCERPLGADGLPPRAAALAALLGGRNGGGPGYLFVISSLKGGEDCDRVADDLAHIAASGRTVHVIAPGLRRPEPGDHAMPGALGAIAPRIDLLEDLHRVSADVRLRRFIRRLRDAGVHFHEIDDDADMEALVSTTLMCAV